MERISCDGCWKNASGTQITPLGDRIMITRVEIGGYRLLSDFEADLKPLNVVIGANASGKSSLIDSLRLVRECCEYPINTAIGWHWGASSLLSAGSGNGQLSWKVDFRKPANAYWNDVPFEKDNPLSYQVVLKADAQGLMHAQYEVLENIHPDAGHKHKGPLKHLEATPYRRQIFDREQHKLIPFDMEQSASTRVQESSAEAIPTGTIASERESALLLSQIRFFKEFPIPAAARYFFGRMTFYPGFDVTRSSSLRTKAAEIKPMSTLEADGSNLGTVLHDILTRYDYRSTAEELRDFLRVAYPAFEEIHCDTTHGAPPQVLVGIREKGMSRSMYLWDLSDGVVRFLCLAMALLNPIPPSLVAIDEPELGLHPGLLPIVAEMIKAAAERTQVLVTTHSPELLNCFGIDDIAVMARDEDEAKAIWYRPSNRKTLVEMLRDVSGGTLGDLHRDGELEAGA